jgi:hypothetical protein
MLAHASSLTQPSDVWALFSDDEEARSLLVGVAGLERLAESDARRTKLDRVVERLERDVAKRRWKVIDAEMVRLSEAGLEIPASLRAEQNLLAATLKKG